MSKINQYQSDSNISSDDRLLGTDAGNSNQTKNFRIADFITFLQQQGFGIGQSAYDSAVDQGFEGTEAEWLQTLVGTAGQSAYALAVANGFEGTESEWLESLHGQDGEAGTVKTSGQQTLSATPTVLSYDVNSVSFQGGKAFLPATTEIGREIIVIATANSIEVRANAANTAHLFETFQTFITGVTLSINDVYRFTYIGFGGYWKAEKLANANQGVDYLVYTALISQSGTAAPTAKVLKNTLGATISFSRNGIGNYTAQSSLNVFTTDKTALISNYNSNGAFAAGSINFYSLGAEFFAIETRNSVTPTDSVIVDAFIEIRVYP